MNICRNRVWTTVVRLPFNSARLNSVIAQKWHSIAPTPERNSIGRRWEQFPKLKVHTSFVAYILSARHFASAKYANKLVAKKKQTKTDTKTPDEKAIAAAAIASAENTASPETTIASPVPPKTCDDLLAADPEKKLGLFARFKLMSKQYWYVLLPVHVVTSCMWFGGFYYLSSSGVDIPTMLESLSISEAIIAKIRDSTMGHLAIAYMCYKIVTPIRYTVTLGGTTISIKYLSQWGYIRPLPSKEKLKQMYEDQKAKFKREKEK